MTHEYLDIVDEEDNVIGHALREEIYAQNLRHRIVHVLLFDDQGDMWLQKRSAEVSFCPNHWVTAVGGHVQMGEDPEQAAVREFEEELGLSSPLEFFHKDFYEVPSGPPKFLFTYTARHNGPFQPDPAAVEQVASFPLSEIENMITAGEKMHPELLFLLDKYFLKKPTEFVSEVR